MVDAAGAHTGGQHVHGRRSDAALGDALQTHICWYLDAYLLLLHALLQEHGLDVLTLIASSSSRFSP